LCAQCRGCPRNCKRRVKGRFCHWARLTLLGRRPETATREPGDLPPATSHARTRWAGCPDVNVESGCFTVPTKGEWDRQSAKIAVTGTFFAVGAWRVACQKPRPRLRPFFRIPFTSHLNIGDSGSRVHGGKPGRRANGGRAGNGGPEKASADQRVGTTPGEARPGQKASP
jgi:hypothetical protein